MGELSRPSYPNPPPMVGLCPGEHVDEFYMPLAAGESFICPMCDRVMEIYLRVWDDGPRPDDDAYARELAKRLGLDRG